MADTETKSQPATSQRLPDTEVEKPLPPVRKKSRSNTAVSWRRLTDKELVERLCLSSKSLVDELYSITLRQLQAEDQRQARLDGKAQGLLATTGLSITIAFTFGSLLLQHPEYLYRVSDWLAQVVAGLYGVALIFGISASIQALRALLVRDEYRSSGADDIFNQGELDAAENAQDDSEAGTKFRRYLTAHLYLIYQAHFEVHEQKARIIKRGQQLFFFFLCAIFLVGIAMTISVFTATSSPPAGPATEESAPSQQSPPKQPPSSRPPPTSIPSGGVPRSDGGT